MLEQVSIYFLFHLCRFVRVRFVQISTLFRADTINTSVRLSMVVGADIVGIRCAVYSGAWCPYVWDLSFPSALCRYRRISVRLSLSWLCGNIKHFVRKREVRCASFFFLNVGPRLLLFSLLFFSFPAKEEHVVKGKIIEYFPLLLAVAPMERIGGWSHAGEDPKLLYTGSALEGGQEGVA